MRIIAAALLALALCGCAAKKLVTPLDVLDTTRAGPYYQVKRGGVTFAMEPLSYREDADNLGGKLLPVWIVIVNATQENITVSHSQFTLRDQWGSEYQLWKKTQFYIFLNGRNFSFFYYGPFPFLWWPWWEYEESRDRPVYRAWDGQAKAGPGVILPEGTVRPGQSVRGAILFKVTPSEYMKYTVSWKPFPGKAPYEIMFTAGSA